ncbi:MAG: hypothetical protein AB9856_11950 [Cellulosilyticaceae bacterium]
MNIFSMILVYAQLFLTLVLFVLGIITLVVIIKLAKKAIIALDFYIKEKSASVAPSCCCEEHAQEASNPSQE